MLEEAAVAMRERRRKIPHVLLQRVEERSGSGALRRKLRLKLRLRRKRRPPPRLPYRKTIQTIVSSLPHARCLLFESQRSAIRLRSGCDSDACVRRKRSTTRRRSCEARARRSR